MALLRADGLDTIIHLLDALDLALEGSDGDQGATRSLLICIRKKARKQETVSTPPGRCPKAVRHERRSDR